MFSLLIICLVIILDQLSKTIILNRLQPGISVPVIKKVFSLNLVYNQGAAFGSFANFSFLLTLISLGIIFLFLMVLIKYKLTKKRFWLLELSLGLILGGALGNFLDRLRFGYVVDFLDFHIWPVFNLADTMITCGAFILIILLIKKKI